MVGLRSMPTAIHRDPVPKAMLLATLGGLVALVTFAGVLDGLTDIWVAGVIGLMAVAVAFYSRDIGPLCRAAFVVALIALASIPVLAWKSSDEAHADTVRSASETAVIDLVRQASQQALGRTLTRDEEWEVARTHAPLGASAPERLDALLHERIRRDTAASRGPLEWQWAFYAEMCRQMVGYSIDDPYLAPMVRRYISAFGSDDTRFHLEPSWKKAVRKAADRSRFRNSLQSCGTLFEFM